MELNRRNFIKAAAGATGLFLLKPSAPALAKNLSSKDDLAMLIDVTKCVSCWWCYAACKEYNGLPETYLPDPAEPPPLSPGVWTTLTPVMAGSELYTRKLACNHCTDAACVEVCPTGALSYNEKGFVEYNRDKCSGCGYCAEFCPYGVPQMQKNVVTGLAVMNKCTFCKERVLDGEKTACADACTTGAITFGKREELLEEGKARAASLKSENPDAGFYGENELGGLHVMYVLDDSAEAYGLPDAPQVPASTAVRTVLGWLGIGVTAVALLGFGFNYLVAKFRMANGEKE